MMTPGLSSPVGRPEFELAHDLVGFRAHSLDEGRHVCVPVPCSAFSAHQAVDDKFDYIVNEAGVLSMTADRDDCVIRSGDSALRGRR